MPRLTVKETLSPLLRQLRNTHASLLASGRQPDPAFATKLIHAYCIDGKISRARDLFDEMPSKNTVHFSVMIHGYATNGFFAESLQLFSHMHSSGARPNSFTIVAVLLSSAGMRAPRLGESIHGRTVKSGLESNPFVRTAMLDSYAKCGNPMNSYKLFNEMDPPSLVACNAMIAGFAHNDLFEEALLLFKRLGPFELAPNPLTMTSVTRNCIGYGSFRLCESVHGHIFKLGLVFDVIVMNSVFDMYLSFGNSEIAADFFRKMDVVDVVSWTTMIGFLVDIEHTSEALHMFRRMRANGVDPDMVAMISVIAACELSGDLRMGRSAHNQIVVRGFRFELPVMNSLITMYSNGGDPESARLSFDCIVGKSLVSWTAMVSGFVHNGQPGEGLGLLIRMRREENFDIDSIMLVSALTACGDIANFQLCVQFHGYSLRSGVVRCKSVENSLVAMYGKCGCLDLARRVFDEMTFRDVVSWNAMITSYGVNGEGESAVSLYLEMEKFGVELDNVTYLNVLNACSHSGLVDDGLTIFERMVRETGIDPSAEHYGCVVDMLARGGRLEEARRLVSSMSEGVGPNVWKALLRGYCSGGDVVRAEDAADRVFRMSSMDPGHVVTLSNVYASVGKFASAEKLRSRIKKKGLMKDVGFSCCDALSCDFG